MGRLGETTGLVDVHSCMVRVHHQASRCSDVVRQDDGLVLINEFILVPLC